MERKTANDFDQELLDLFDQYVHGGVDRRGFLDRAGKFAVGGVTAAMLLDALSPKFAEAQQVPPDDKRLKTEHVEYPSPQGYGKMRGYLVRPASAAGKLPGHPRRPREPRPEPAHRGHHAASGARQLHGASRPMRSSPLGGYPGDEDKARELFPKLDQTKTREDFVAAANWLKARADCTGKDRRGRLLLRRRHRQHAGDARARPRRAACRSTAASRRWPTCPRSRRRC